MSDLSLPELLAMVAGIILSLGFSYIPGLNTWYAALSEEVKKLIMLALIVVVGAGAYGLACAGYLERLFDLALTCDEAGLLLLIRSVIFAAIANQTTYKLTPQSRAVKTVKAIQDGLISSGYGRG